MSVETGWLQLSVNSGGQDPELIENALLELGALAVTLADAGDAPVLEPLPNETPLWPDTRVTGLFERSADPMLLRARLAQRLGDDALTAGRLSIDDLAERDWVRVWLDDFKPMRFGERLWICPSQTPPPEPDAVNILLDPGLAFGTGTHPTTALCLQWLDGQTLTGQRVLDYGCGSGVLAIAALRLGAAAAVGVDIDPQALLASRANADANGVAGLTLYLPDALPPQGADVLLANILAGPLIELAPRLADSARRGGRLALSGILDHQAEAVAAAYRPWFTLEPPRALQEWALLSGVRR